MNLIKKYYKEIIDIIIDKYSSEFSNAKPGHCMKISGLGEPELVELWERMKDDFPEINTFVLNDSDGDDSTLYISANKLIEYRNLNLSPLLILIPSNKRTAAEDSYGNATFKEIRIDNLDHALFRKLETDIPDEYSQVIINEILAFLQPSINEKIEYLLALKDSGFNKENVGNFIYLLQCIPDSKLITSHEKTRIRLNYNRQSIELLSNFGKPVYDKISELPLEPDTLQRDLVKFLKGTAAPKTRKGICVKIFEDNTDLNFSNWKIPDLDFTKMELFVSEIISTSFKEIAGRKVLVGDRRRGSKVKIKIVTTPKPNEISKLQNFRISLFEVDGASGQEVVDLRRLKCTPSPRPSREATVEIDPNLIEEGSFFFRVFAEDEKGNILNISDKFKEARIQKTYEEGKQRIVNDYLAEEQVIKLQELDLSFNYKRTHDSEDFDFIIDESGTEPQPARKDKLNNVLQAFFIYRIDKLKNSELSEQIAEEGTNCWSMDDTKKLISTFHIKYHNKHNFQILVPSKLRQIEDLVLKHNSSFGYASIGLFNNPAVPNLKSIKYVDIKNVNHLVPKELKEKRIRFFSSIINSTADKKGIFETCELFKIIEEGREYITEFFNWTADLQKRIRSIEGISQDERLELQQLFTQLQTVDTIQVNTTLPDQQPIEVILLSPLHPLRIAWFIQLYDLFINWEEKTSQFSGHLNEWAKNLEPLFEGRLSPENNPLILFNIDSNKDFQYAGEISFGWGLYIRQTFESRGKETLASLNRQIKSYLQNILYINKESYYDSDVSQALIVRHLKNYIHQHPYTEKLIINLLNAGDAIEFANSLVELEKDGIGRKICYEIRIFKGKQSFINHGESLRNLINPEYNVSEEAEAFSQPSINRLFPKLRFSINNIEEYLDNPSKFAAHLSFLINPFPTRSELIKVRNPKLNFFLNGLITSPSIHVEESDKEISWKKFIYPNKLNNPINDFSDKGIQLFGNLQSYIAGALSSQSTDSIPATELFLSEKDKVLISLLHDYSDWVITFDKNLGPQIFDQPSKNGHIPFLLDYIPGEEISGISSYLTTRPTSEVLGLLAPHFEEFDLDVSDKKDEEKIKILLEDLRAISSSLILQLNSSKNKAFEVIGAAFTKRVLEKKRILNEAFLIPIDLHQNLFENLSNDNKSRADNLLVKIDTKTRIIEINVIEVKCRKSLAESERIELKEKIKKQIENTIEALQYHFDPQYSLSHDRLDRNIKNKELKSMLEFYMDRANRYKYLDDQIHQNYMEFVQTLDSGFQITFKQLGLIFDFSAPQKHKKEVIDNELTFFTFGHALINEILDPNSDLNTKRLENEELENDLSTHFGSTSVSSFIQQIGNTGQAAYPVIDKIIIDAPEIRKVAEEYINTTQNVEIVERPEDNSSSVDASQPHEKPPYDILVGKNGESPQYGIIGKSIHGKKVAMDLSETNTVSLFGVQGSGKSYSIGIVSEMVLKEVKNVNLLPSPLAGVIFHYSESMDYEPEFTSMIYPNDKIDEIRKLKQEYGIDPERIEDIIILTPKDKVEERIIRYPSIPVLPISFNSSELNVQDWLFLLGAVGNDSTYIKQLRAIMKENRNNLSVAALQTSVENSGLLSNVQKALARQRLLFAQEYIDDSFHLKEILRPGKLILVDLRDEFVEKDQALGLFVIMLNIFSSVKTPKDEHFNKFIVFDEAHKYMDNKELTNSIVTAIREMRHKGVSIMIASQDPPSLPNEIIELSSIVIVHKFNSPQWLKHIQKSITQLDVLTPSEMSALQPGECFIWTSKATDKTITTRPVKMYTRPRFTKHGGGTIKAI
jgi:DNA phosphorothioation-dependent restriction protein DptH